MMNRILLFVFVVCFFFTFIYSSSNLACATPSESNPTNALEDVIEEWKAPIFVALLLSVSFISLAYMVGNGFSIPQLKAWAIVEIGNVFLSALIVLSIVGVVTFVDEWIRFQVNNAPSSPFHCDPNTFCTASVSAQYLDGLINLSKSVGKNAFIQATQAIQNQIKGDIFSCGTLIWPPCLMFSHTQRPNAFMILDYERSSIEMGIASEIANVLNIQRFFAVNVAPLIGPILIALGIFLRTIPQLRRVGGVLLAVGLGIFFVFPAMYAWNAMTINVAVYGDELASTPSDCPEACTKPIPIGFKGNKIAYTISDIGCFGTQDDNIVKFLNGTIESLNGFTSCEYLAKSNQYGYCPPICRQLPYPYYIGGYDENDTPFGCGDPDIERACNHLDRRCKVIRNDTHTTCDPEKCPDYCKTVLPMKADAGCDACVNVPHSCRVALRNGSGFPKDGLNWRLKFCLDAGYGDALEKCPASMNPEQSCMYVIGEPPDKACDGPLCCIGPDCKFEYVEGEDAHGDYSLGVAYSCNGKFESTERCKLGTCFTEHPELYDECEEDLRHNCTELAMFPVDLIEKYYPYCKGKTNDQNAHLWYNVSAACWDDWCRMKNGKCDPDTPPCVGQGRDLEEPSARCNGCGEVRQACVFDNNYIMFCDEECLEGEYGFGNPTKITPAEFVKTSQKSMVGRQDMIDVASLLFPAYALPLLNIIVTIMFIRTFAPLFGGDFYLPGWAKVI